MSKLCITLPPLAPDYSGAASALFELGGMIVIHDAAGCTGNYTGYDEPRWLGSNSAIYCSGLRHMDAILGNDYLLVDRIKETAESIKPNFIALLGSPVPMVIGTDFEGLALEIETVTGIPTIGLTTRGLAYYGHGIAYAINTLMRKVCEPSVSEQDKNDGINILGMTPLDFGKEPNQKDFVKLFEENGFKVNCCFTMGCTFEEFKQSIKSRLNIVVSQSGYNTALYMKETYNIPFVVGTPMAMGKLILEKIDSERFKCNCKNSKKISDSKILITGDQVISNSLREYLEIMGCKNDQVDVGVLFDSTPELLHTNDFVIKNEKQLREILNSGKYHKIIADPLIEQLITKKTQATGIKFFQLSHVAVSSKIHWNQQAKFLSGDFVKFIKEIVSSE